MSLYHGVKNYLQGHLISGKPILLGYSGGPDSKALFHLLLECRRTIFFDLHLAHLDHGWRPESGEEAAQLQEEAAFFSIPFHLKVLTPSDYVPGNLEAQGRQHRMQFFSKLYQTLDCGALFLGHHKDDQAEVVLKRLFEGAQWANLGGMRGESHLSGMRICRPLLSVRKKEILEWLDERGLTAFFDSTNASPAFLRGRMRTTLIPLLEEQFGKRIADNLGRLGKAMQELREYFAKKLAPILEKIDKEMPLDLSDVELEKVELTFLLLEWFSLMQVTASESVVENISTAFFEKKEPLSFPVSKGFVHLHRKKLILSN